MLNVGSIVQGHLKAALKLEEELSKSRLKICRKCSIYKKDKFRGDVCNGNMYISPITFEGSIDKIDGWVKGCNCTLEAKTRMKDMKCVVDKW